MTAIADGAPVAVLGAGTMGGGIAQVAAVAGHPVTLFDVTEGAVERVLEEIARRLARAVERERMTAAARDATLARIRPSVSLADAKSAALVIEAVVEELGVKHGLFRELELIVAPEAVFASNTSSLSITALAAGLRFPERVVGMHFFNPAPVMALVEVVSGLGTGRAVADAVYALAERWGKSPVHARSTPGFIVNRVARPFYGEGLRLLDEGAAEVATIDAVLREAGGFRMGPFELIDLIGLDVNLAVSRSVHAAFHGDPRYAPSIIQQDYVDAGRLGRKSGRGFYDYGQDAVKPRPATAPGAPAPSAVLVEGNLGPAEGLVDAIAAAGIAVTRDEAGPAGPMLVLDGAALALTDGRLAAERAHEPRHPLVLFDLALDWAACTRVAVAPAPNAGPAALMRACGLFQALGKQVSVVADSPALVVMRTVAMLSNEAADAVLHRVCDAAAVDTAMRKGVNYPDGPLALADRLGPARVLAVLDNLARLYGEDRYRASLLLRRLVAANARFHEASRQ